MANLRFEFRVLNDAGEEIVTDWTTFDADSINEFGGVETIDMHTGSALRFLRRQHIAGKLNPAEAA